MLPSQRVKSIIIYSDTRLHVELQVRVCGCAALHTVALSWTLASLHREFLGKFSVKITILILLLGFFFKLLRILGRLGEGSKRQQ